MVGNQSPHQRKRMAFEMSMVFDSTMTQYYYKKNIYLTHNIKKIELASSFEYLFHSYLNSKMNPYQ